MRGRPRLLRPSRGQTRSPCRLAVLTGTAVLLVACARPETTAGVPSRPLPPPAVALPVTSPVSTSSTSSTVATPTTARPVTPTPTTVPSGTASPTADVLATRSTHSAGPGSSPSSPPRPGLDPFAGRRVVAYYGAPGTGALGVLGVGTPAQAWTRLDAQARAYDAPGRPAARVFELIVTVASDSPGSSGLYRNRVSAAAIGPYLQAVRAHGGTLLLDVQPGRSDFLDEAEALQPWLEQPDVGLALDPEWRMGPARCPGGCSAPSTPPRSIPCRRGWRT